MPFEHVVDHQKQLVVVTGSGEGSVEEFTVSARRLFEDQSIGANYRLMILVDDTAVVPDSKDIPFIVSLLRAVRSRIAGPMAIVTSRPGRVTTAILVALATGDESVRHFDSEGEARNWLLGIPFAA